MPAWFMNKCRASVSVQFVLWLMINCTPMLHAMVLFTVNYSAAPVMNQYMVN
jgi:hypothetical protein